MKFNFIEPFPVMDIFAHRLAYTEVVGRDLFRFIFTVEQICPMDGSTEHVVCCKLVVPKRMALKNQRHAARGMGAKGFVTY